MYYAKFCPLRRFFFTTVFQGTSEWSYNAVSVHFQVKPANYEEQLATQASIFPASSSYA